MGIQYSLVNIVWGTASTGSYGGTVFPGGVRYSLVNNVCGVRYSLGYRIHSDTVYIGKFLPRKISPKFAPMYCAKNLPDLISPHKQAVKF